MLYSVLAAVHVITIVLWIGGVAFVTIIIFPLIQKMTDAFEQVIMFQRIEHRFARHAKVYIAVSGVTGFWMLGISGMHDQLLTERGTGLWAMIFAWTFYLLVLTFEKRLFKKLFGKPGAMDARKIFRGLGVFHWVVLGISLLAVFLGVYQGHGGRF